jgi:hypothetical protein
LGTNAVLAVGAALERNNLVDLRQRIRGNYQTRQVLSYRHRREE